MEFPQSPIVGGRYGFIVIAGRSRADRTLSGRHVAGEVERSCKFCGRAILLTPRGQSQEREAADKGLPVAVVCTRCATKYAALAARLGTRIAPQLNAAAAESIRDSAVAAELWDQFQAVIQPRRKG